MHLFKSAFFKKLDLKFSDNAVFSSLFDLIRLRFFKFVDYAGYLICPVMRLSVSVSELIIAPVCLTGYTLSG